jgi:DNA invertase Pin-like site-specific DNA recombinase
MSPAKKPTKPVVIYTRTSEQGRRSDEELLTHKIQREQVEHYLAAKNLTACPEVFEDTDKSGGSLSRPAFDRAIAGVLDKKYGGIAVAYLDRFARNRDADTLISKIEDAGGVFIALDFDFDTSTAMGRAMLAVVLAFATLTREQAVEKAVVLGAKKLREGTSMGGAAPLGYSFDVTGHDENGKPLLGWLVQNDDAPLVREAFELFASGATIGAVARFLNEKGARTRRTKANPDGNPWTIKSARDFLRREVYTGTRTYGEQRFENTHVAIIGPVLWRKVERSFAPVVKKHRVKGLGFALGEGLVRCGKCGKGLSRSKANGTTDTLRCTATPSVGHPSITLSLAHEHVVEAALAHWGGENYQRAEGGNAAEVEAAEARVAAAEDAKREAEEYIGAELPASSPLALAVVEALEARDALDPQDTYMRTFVLSADDPQTRDIFEALDPPTQRSTLRAMGVERVVLLEGVKGSAADRLRIEFTDGTTWNAAAYQAERDARAEAEWARFAEENPEAAAETEAAREAIFAATA